MIVTKDEAAALEAAAASRIIARLQRFGVDSKHVIASTVHEAGYVDDRDDQLHPWPASMTRVDVGDLVELERGRRVFEQFAQGTA